MVAGMEAILSGNGNRGGSMIENLCAECGRSFPRYSTFQRKCNLCSYNSLSNKRPIKRMGKVAKQWSVIRNQWIKRNPPSHNGYYKCYYCQLPVHIDEVQVDHKQSRTRHPELRYELSNLVPTCAFDNIQKGSMGVEEYLSKYYPKRLS